MNSKSSPTLWQRLQFRNWRISAKMSAVILISALAPLILATYFNSRTSSDALAQQTRIGLSRLSFSTAQRIEQFLIDNHNFIRMAASDPQVIAFINAEPDDREVLQADIDQVMENVLESNPALDLIGFYDLDGIVVAHNLPNFVGQDYSVRDFFQSAVTGQQFTTSIQVGLTTGLPGLAAAAPVNSDGDTVGVVATRIQGTFIDQILESTLEIETADVTAIDRAAMDIYLVNKYGLIMSHSNPDSEWLYRGLGTIATEVSEEVQTLRLLGGKCPDDAETCDASDRIPAAPESIPAVQPLADVMLDAIADGVSGSSRYCSPADVNAPLPESGCDGEWKVAAYAPVHDPFPMSSGATENLLLVVVEVPESVFLQAVDEQRQQGVGIAMAMGIVAIFVAGLIARTLAQPIGKLANAALRVEHDEPFEPEDIGDLITQRDEIGNLSRIFSEMVVALRARMTELQTIYEIGSNITSSVDLNPTLMYIADSLSKAIPYDAAEICLYDRKTKKMVMSVETGAKARGQTQTGHREYALDAGYFDRLLKDGGGLLISEVQPGEVDHTGRVWEDLTPRSYLGVPLKIKNETIGSIELVSGTPNVLSKDNLRVLESIAVQAAIAVQNAQEVQQRERKLKQEIQKLQIEIDQARKSQQVSEITESDYFHTLKEKARLLRSGRSASSDE